MILGLTQEQKRLEVYVAGLVGANPTYVDLFFQGYVIGTEFLTYDPKKLYIAFEIELSMEEDYDTGRLQVILYNQANVMSFQLRNDFIYWNGAQARYFGNNISSNNIYFSRLAVPPGLMLNYSHLKFNGIKVTWP